METSIEDLIGRILIKIENNEDELIFTCNSGIKYHMYHSQSCCETVTIEDISGDLNDLIGSPILKAEEKTKVVSNTKKEKQRSVESGSFTWTFYTIATINGYVDIRWFGESNGNYSEKVDFIKL